MFGARVAEYLLKHGWVTTAQVEEARRTQGFFGGQLESHFLKLGYVSETVLGDALTEVAGVPFASWDHLRAVSQATLDAVPERLAAKLRVCPIRLEEGRLRVATLNPRDANALRELQTATGHVIEPWITIESRLYQALERWYRLRFEGTKRIALSTPSEPASAGRQETEERESLRRRSSEPEVGLDGRPLDAEIDLAAFFHRSEESVGETTAPAAAPAAAAPAAAAPAAAAPADPAPAEPRPTAQAGAQEDVEAFDEALASSRDRHDIAEALFGYCAGRAARIGLFAVSKSAVRGVAGRGRAFDTEALASVSVAIGSGTVFDTALQSRDFYFGVVPGLPANRDLYTALGGRLPASVMLLPVVVQDRTVALLYLDGDDGALPRPDIPLMRRVAAKMSLAFEMLLLRNKIREI